jgi:hypothetical protein
MSVRTCRRCQCTAVNACFTVIAEVEQLSDGKHVLRNIKSSVACSWAESDLCTACVQPIKVDTSPAPAVRVIDNLELYALSLDKEPGPYGGTITMVERKTQPTHQLCPLGSGNTHHLVPKDGELTCKYCAKSESWLRERANGD